MGRSTKAMERDVARAVGRTSENGLVKNEAALKIETLLGKKAAQSLGETLQELRLEPQQYSLVFKDKGLRLKAVGAIAEKARVTDFPTDELTVYSEFDTFMNYCDTFMISPTLGLFAAWLGEDVDGFERRLVRYRNERPSTAAALDVAKELLRGFIETKALDGDIAPAVYLHQNKAYFNAVETSKVQHENVQKDAHVRDMTQIAEVIDLLPDSVKERF